MSGVVDKKTFDALEAKGGKRQLWQRKSDGHKVVVLMGDSTWLFIRNHELPQRSWSIQKSGLVRKYRFVKNLD